MLRSAPSALMVMAATIVGQAEAKTLIECGGSSGREFYFDNDEWRDSTIGKGKIALIRNGDEIDILISDAIGLFSTAAQGGSLHLVDASEGVITVLVDYHGKAKELYSFDFKRKKVVWSQHKMTGLIDKAHTMIADCE